MPIDPEEIGPANLPRTSLGGYKSGPTDDLLKRVAWDYRQLVHEHRTNDHLRVRALPARLRQHRTRQALLQQRLQLHVP